ncbi:WD40/YVTN/BNR-like repeat-containing protein [Flammeovirga agarivorans]|uniref:Sortilin N-terminal domain-containing protein n=1 Tax=Flammeovirga agarivorans TaxID=2726742 RepID=A0A7X8SQN8_9BACT|nr:hypothetical protein [Flammeovirga agarivorans]NLR94635.1 hypothetical protein [Flammeovirga agarivorans]
MKTISPILLLFLLLFFSCNQINPSGSDLKQREFENWIEIPIPDGREAFGIAGSLSDTLLVTTWTNAYYSTDSGNTWILSKNFQGPIYDLVDRNDTIFAMQLTTIKDYLGPPSIRNQQFSKNGYYFTTDFGKTWEKDETSNYFELESPIGIATSKNGTVYRLNHDLNWISANTYEINYSDIEKHIGLHWELVDLPVKYGLNNLYFDKDNHLYVSAKSDKYIVEINYQGPYQTQPGLIYYYKKEL